MTLEELKNLVKYSNKAINEAISFTSDYDWNHEWESFSPIEACKDAYIEGIWFAINNLENKE